MDFMEHAMQPNAPSVSLLGVALGMYADGPGCWLLVANVFVRASFPSSSLTPLLFFHFSTLCLFPLSFHLALFILHFSSSTK